MKKKSGARKQYNERQAVNLLLPVELVEYIDSVTKNRTRWLADAAQEKRKREETIMVYTYNYEVVLPGEKVIKDSMEIEANSPDRAKEFGDALIEDQYPEETQLLEASVACPPMTAQQAYDASCGVITQSLTDYNIGIREVDDDSLYKFESYIQVGDMPPHETYAHKTLADAESQFSTLAGYDASDWTPLTEEDVNS